MHYYYRTEVKSHDKYQKHEVRMTGYGGSSTHRKSQLNLECCYDNKTLYMVGSQNLSSIGKVP